MKGHTWQYVDTSDNVMIENHLSYLNIDINIGNEHALELERIRSPLVVGQEHHWDIWCLWSQSHRVP